MSKLSSYFRLGLALALVAAFVIVGLGAESGAMAAAATATAAPTQAATPAPIDVSAYALCVLPTPTPAPTVAETPAATEAATVAATTAPTEAATAASTAAATKAAATKVPTATKKPTSTPTSTSIPKGKVPAWAGITFSTRNVKAKRNGAACVVATNITAGGPADVAGIKSGDFLLGIESNATVKDGVEFFTAVAQLKSGDSIRVVVQHGDTASVKTIVLGLNPYGG